MKIMSKLLAIIALVTLCNVASSEEFATPYDKYIINTVGDYLSVCGVLSNPGKLETENFNNTQSCLSYISGILAGYTSTLSINSEYILAKEMRVSREKIASQIDTNAPLHKKLDSIYFNSHFLCFDKDYGFYDIAKHVYQSLRNKKINLNNSAAYFVLSEMEELLKCPTVK